jgi:hypothetical protein
MGEPLIVGTSSFVLRLAVRLYNQADHMLPLMIVIQAFPQDAILQREFQERGRDPPPASYGRALEGEDDLTALCGAGCGSHGGHPFGAKRLVRMRLPRSRNRCFSHGDALALPKPRPGAQEWP